MKILYTNIRNCREKNEKTTVALKLENFNMEIS